MEGKTWRLTVQLRLAGDRNRPSCPCTGLPSEFTRRVWASLLD